MQLLTDINNTVFYGILNTTRVCVIQTTYTICIIQTHVVFIDSNIDCTKSSHSLEIKFIFVK